MIVVLVTSTDTFTFDSDSMGTAISPHVWMKHTFYFILWVVKVFILLCTQY
ncbi:hypothetical protein [Vibrio phage VP9]|uniref:Uncharacterized protein n=1 Tax=Vibrio phage VP9 TaxID=3025410 RepID=A0AAE9ZN32_9CAUD|nr:hypothetical protein [Vibrio phage VP9]